MYDALHAGLFGWEEVRDLSGWVGLFSVVAMLAITEYMRRTFATKDDLEDEKQDRQTADEHRDREMHRVAEMTQQFVGKVEIIERRQEKADRAREREVSELREEVRTGFARITALLERQNGGNA